MAKQFKLAKLVPFVRPMPQMPDPVELALHWLNAQAGEGWIRPDLTLMVDGETASLGPLVMIRDEPHMLLESDGTAYEYKLEAVVPFVRPVPQMPCPAELAVGWLNGHAEAGWQGPAVAMTFSKAGEVETVTLEFAETVDVRGQAQVLFRREMPNA
jgi:hypothetical protein